MGSELGREWCAFERWAEGRFGSSFEDIAKTGVLGMCFDAWQAALASRPVEPVEGVPIAPAWIKCKERLPETVKACLVVNVHADGERTIGVAWWNGTHFRLYGGLVGRLTHWQPLPPLPERA